MIEIKSVQEIKKMKIACKAVAEILSFLKKSTEVGMTTKELDTLSEKLIYEKKVKPAFKGYRGFPACLCVSVNEQVVHGIPGNKKLKKGDLLSLDFGVIYEGYYGDSALSFIVGHPPTQEQEKLLRITEESLYKGIEQAQVGNHISDISHAVQKHVEAHGFSVVREFVGHGIGRELHEDPQIPNYGEPGEGILLKEGMVLAIEPMVNFGKSEVRVLSDGWTVVTQDGSLSAHFEHTVSVSRKGPEILTERENEESYE
ncbi:MAG: type I methionyl aminopeptidase [Deltaproteobacteria bacterium]|nr:type I methionyl aminopeptidase [Deltaproteobacteria bacterium]